MKKTLFVFIFALSIRLTLLAVFWDSLPAWEPDENGYQLLSIGLLKNQSFRRPFAHPDQPEHLVMPGYPAIMAAIYLAGVNPRRIFIFQCFLDALTAVLITSMVYRLRGSPRTALLGGMMYALWPNANYFCLRLYVETVLAFIIALLFFVFIKKKQGLTLWMGLLCIAGIYVKPNFLLISCIVAFLLFAQGILSVRRQAETWRPAVWAGVRKVLLFSCILCFLTAPWVIRNKLVTGKAVLSTVFTTNLNIITAPYTLAMVHGDGLFKPWSPLHYKYFELFVMETQRDNPGWKDIVNLRDDAVFEGLPPDIQNAWRLEGSHAVAPFFAYMNPLNLDPPARTARRIIREHPFAFLKSHVYGFFRGWWPSKPLWLKRYYRAGNDNGPTKTSFVSVFFPVAYSCWIGLYLVVIVLAPAGAGVLFKDNPLLALAMSLAIFSMTFLPGQILGPALSPR